MEQLITPAVYYRGGTSKAVIIDQRDVPVTDENDLAAWIQAMYGSPDRRQIDGMGGSNFLTSKFAIVGPSRRPDADVDYSFYQVFVTDSKVSKDLNCGNICSAIGPYAIEQGFVKAEGDSVTVRVHATNFNDMIYVTVQTKDGKPRVLGDQHIDGVPGTGSLITVDFRSTVGTHGRGLLPTGNVKDTMKVDGVGDIEVSVVDLANLLIFAKAESFGLTGMEDPGDLMDKQKDVLAKCDQLRYAVAIQIGMVKDLNEAKAKCAISPALALIGPPAEWTDYATRLPHKAAECDFVARVTCSGQVHEAYPGTGSSATGLTALVPGTVLNEITQMTVTEGKVRIGHPTGVVEVDAAYEKQSDNTFKVNRASVIRTARRIMDGQVYAATDRLPWLGGNNPAQMVEPGHLSENDPGPKVAHAAFHAMD